MTRLAEAEQTRSCNGLDYNTTRVKRYLEGNARMVRKRCVLYDMQGYLYSAA
jgi:hypothetical protein